MQINKLATPTKRYLVKSSNKLNNWGVFFILWPFGALVKALYFFRNPKAKNVAWLFCVFFGFVFIYAQPYSIGSADSARYAEDLIEMHNKWLSFDYIQTMFYSEDGYVDIYQPIATWLVAAFTGNPRYLFALFAAVFGYFYIRNLWMIFDHLEKTTKVRLILLLFMLAFALINPIWNINGVRMWTAAQVFAYGILRYILGHDKKGIIWVIISIIFHFSFMFPVSIFLIYLLIPGNLTILFAFFIATSFLSEIDLPFVRSILAFLPEIFQPRVESYTNELYAERLSEARAGGALHVHLAGLFSKWLLYFWVTIVYIYRKRWIKLLPEFRNLFAFTLFLGGFAQVASHIPSGARYMTIVTMLLYGLFVIIVAQNSMNNKLKLFKLLTVPFLSFYLIFQIRVGFDYIGLSTFLSNPFLALAIEDTTPLIEFIKNLL